MAFDSQRYMATEHRPRTADVEVPALAPFFGKEDKPVWKVRSLTANELAKAKDAQDRRKNVAALAEALLAGSKATKVKEIQQALGYGDDVNADIARRLEMLAMGSVDPECPLELAVLLADRHPESFYSLTNKILELTGQGSEEAGKKPANSGPTQKSEPA